MQFVKKLALVLVASAFVAGSLAGCGEKKPDEMKKDAGADAAKTTPPAPEHK